MDTGLLPPVSAGRKQEGKAMQTADDSSVKCSLPKNEDPTFLLRTCIKLPAMVMSATIPELRRQEQGNPWGSLASQLSSVGKFRSQ